MKKKVVSVLLSSVMVMSVFAGVATQVSADEKPVVKFVFTKGGFEGAPENDVILQKMMLYCRKSRIPAILLWIMLLLLWQTMQNR